MSGLPTVATRLLSLGPVKRLASACYSFYRALRHPDRANGARGAFSAAAFRPEQASLTEDELPLLRELVEESNRLEGPIVEIGTLLGLTTTKMALWKSPGKRIITVDKYCWNPWGLSRQAHQALAGHVLHYLVHAGQVQQVAVDKAAFYATYRGPAPSLVFLDAVHDYVQTKADIAWARQVRAGVVCGHDYSEEFPGVVRAVDEAGGPRRLGGTVWAL